MTTPPPQELIPAAVQPLDGYPETHEEKHEVNKAELKATLTGAGIAYIGTGLTVVLSFLTKVVAVRLTSTADFGLYVATFAFASVVLALTTLGLQDGVARFVAVFHGKEQPEKAARVFRDSLLIVLPLSVLVTVILWLGSSVIATNIIKDSRVVNELWPMWVALPIWSYTTLTASYFQGRGLLVFKALLIDVSRLGAFLVFMLVLALVWKGDSFGLLVMASALGIVVSGVLTLFGASRVPPRYQLAPESSTGELLRYSLPLLTLVLSNLVVGSINLIVLAFVTDARQAAYYSTVLGITQFVTIGGTVFEMALLPTFIMMQTKGRGIAMERVYWALTRWAMLLVLLVGFVLFCFADTALLLVYGKDYVAAAPGLRFAVLVAMFSVLAGPNDAAMRTFQSPRLLVFFKLTSAIATVIIGWLLAPQLGFIGMVVAWGVGLVYLNLGYEWVLYRHKILTTLPREIVIVTALSFLGVLLPTAITRSMVFPLRFVVSVVIFAVIFGSLVMVFRRLHSAEDRLVWEWVQQRLPWRRHRTN